MKEYVKPLLMGVSTGIGIAVIVELGTAIEKACNIMKCAEKLDDRDWNDLKDIIRSYRDVARRSYINDMFTDPKI